MSSSLRLYLTLLPLLLIGSTAIGFPINGFGTQFRAGLVLGTLFAQIGQSALIAAWGIGAWKLRGCVALVILGLTLAGIACDSVSRGIGAYPELLGILIGGLLNWSLMFGALVIIRKKYGLRLQHCIQPARQFPPTDRQFGLRQLFYVMAVVGVILGVGRTIVTPERLQYAANLGFYTLIIIYIMVSIVLMLTLLCLTLAMLQQRPLALVAVPLALFVVGLATAFELLLLNYMFPGEGPDKSIFVWINLIGFGWTVLYLLLIRLQDFVLAAPPLGTIDAPVASTDTDNLL